MLVDNLDYFKLSTDATSDALATSGTAFHYNITLFTLMYRLEYRIERYCYFVHSSPPP